MPVAIDPQLRVRGNGILESSSSFAVRLVIECFRLDVQESPQVILRDGGVGERLKPAVLKTVRPERVSGVQIPPPPPLQKSTNTSVRLVQSQEEPQQGRAVVARTMNSGSIVIAFGYGIFVGALILSKRVFAAVTPISRSGCRTVVSAGF